VVIEGRLGDVGVLDDLVDPDVPHAAAREQFVGGFEDP
jgi:hypothetical protein